MNSSDSPSKIIKAFGVNGLKNTIPVDSSTSTDNNGIATFDKGFPQITMQPLSAGGIPPSGKDMNGVLYSVTIQQQWQNAGMGYLFDPTYASNISGYPQGATIPSSDYSGSWINTTNGNTNNPEGTTALPTGWVPGYAYGSSAVTISTANVNVSDILAAKDRIILTGTLTGNRILYLPQWIKDWTIENKCASSDYSVIISTKASGSPRTVQSIPGTIINIHSDGSNISSLDKIANYVVFNNSGSFIAPQGIYKVKVIVTGGGGSGAGSKGTSTSQPISGGGGGAGGTSIAYVSVVPGKSYPIIVGNGGAQVSGATSGNNGGDSSFNGAVFGRGGIAGEAGGGGGSGGSSSGGFINFNGGDGGDGQAGQFVFSGNGGASFWGGGGRAGSGSGRAAAVYGAGGGGVYDRNMSGASLTSGAGAKGVVVIEY